MQTTSLVDTMHVEDINLPRISQILAGLEPVEFDKAVRPLREHLKQFDEDGKLSELMLITNVTNHIVDGLYVRELLLPKGSFVLSRVHKKPLVNIISKGYVIVIDSNGHNEYKAPCTFTSVAGTQRVVYAPEETVWNTAHAVDIEDESELVEAITFDNYREFISYSKQLT